jgi:hypothetical protein
MRTEPNRTEPNAGVTYRGETTAPGVAVDCRDRRDCTEHYVVRDGGIWVRAFHNERDARIFAQDRTEERFENPRDADVTFDRS